MSDDRGDGAPVWVRWRRQLCAGVGALGVLGSALAAGSARDFETRAIEATFALDAAERENAIEHHAEDATEALHALSAFYAAAVQVDAQQFHAFVANELSHHESVRAMGWNPVVAHAHREAFELDARAHGSPGYRITESAPHGEMVAAAVAEEYVAVRYIEPFARNESALGFNVRSERIRREALERARDTGELVITAPVCLVQDLEQRAGFLGFIAYYGGARPTMVAERRASVRGYLVAVFQAQAILDSALRHFDPIGLNLELFDITDPESPHLARAGPGTAEGAPQPLQRSSTLQVGGRAWKLTIESTPAYLGERRTTSPAWVLVAGLVITGLLSAFLLLLLRGFSERERARLEVLDRERRLRLTLDAVADGAWDWNLATGDVHFSDSWLAGLGYAREDVDGHVSFWEGAVHPDDLPLVRRLLEDHFAGRTEVYECENRLRRSDGDYRWNLDRGRVVERAEDGTPLRMVGTDTDISARRAVEEENRELEQRVRHTQKLESLGVLAGGIAHDFNNLLVAVLGSADLALKEMPPDAPGRRQLERIKTAGSRASDLTRQMLAYAGGGRLVVERVDLCELVQEMLSLLRASISKKAELLCEFSDDDVGVDGDGTQLRQVVMNLITNASDALERRAGTIHVRTGVQDSEAEHLRTLHLGEDCPAGRYAFVEVSDSGVGMREDVRERMFDPFFSTKFNGRGLGLAAVIGIVSSHCGAIGIASESGRGTTIRVLFPAAGPRAAAGPEIDESISQWRASGTALVVDDEEAVREVAQELLESCGFSVLTAADGVEGVEVFREHAREIDVVVLDMSMPRMDGAEAFRRIRRVRPDTCVVFSSGFGKSDSVRELYLDEHVGFVQKPYLASEFLERIRAAVES